MNLSGKKTHYMTRLWRVPVNPATNEESRKVKLSGTRTEVSLFIGDLCLFLCNARKYTFMDDLISATRAYRV